MHDICKFRVPNKLVKKSPLYPPPLPGEQNLNLWTLLIKVSWGVVSKKRLSPALPAGSQEMERVRGGWGVNYGKQSSSLY